MPHLLDNYGNKENRHWYTYLHRLHHSHLHHSYRRVRNASTSTFSVPETTVDIIGGWNNYNWIYDETLNGADYWTYKLDVANAFRIHFYYNNADGANTAATSSTGGTIKESTPTPVVTNLSPR